MPHSQTDNSQAYRRLVQYRVIEDALEEGLSQWLQSAAQKSFQGNSIWCVVPSYHMAGWLRQRMLQNGKSLFGIDFLDMAELRSRLASRLNLERRGLGRESLELLLRIEAMKRNSHGARSVAIDPSDCLRALDDLGRAGWTGSETPLGEIPSPARQWVSVLEKSDAWTPALDRELLAKAHRRSREETNSLSLCFVGWDASALRDWRLVRAAISCANDLEFYVPSPRILEEDPDQDWLELLEKWMRVEAEVAADADFASANQTLSDRLFRQGDGSAGASLSELQLPTFLVGQSWRHQLALIQRQVCQWLKENQENPKSLVDSHRLRIGVVVPMRGATSLELVQTLSQAGLPIHDDVGEIRELSAELSFQAALVEYYLNDCGLSGALQVLEVMRELSPESPEIRELSVHPVVARNLFNEVFPQVQSRNLPMLRDLVRPAPQVFHRPEWQKLHAFAQLLEEWPSELTWEQAKDRWTSLLSSFGMKSEKLEPLWSLMDEVLEGGELSSWAFFKYLQGILTSTRAERSVGCIQPFAPVVITTVSGALHQTWDHLIFCDCNEGVWPVPVEENPFLNDRLREELNDKAPEQQQEVHLLLTSVDQRLLDTRHFLDLIESCRGEIALTAQSIDPADPGRELYPNEWMVQCLLLEESGQELRHRWETLVKAGGGECSMIAGATSCYELTEANRNHLKEVRDRRVDETKPFDEYLFNFETLDGGSAEEEHRKARGFSATELDRMVNVPASFALEYLFGWKSRNRYEFERKEALPLGSLVHDALGSVITQAIESGDGLKWSGAAASLEQFFERRHREMGAAYSERNQPLPLWWKTLLERAEWSCRQCLRQMEALPPYPYVEIERKDEEVISTKSGPLTLKGRFDLTLRDQEEWENASVTLVDFKTGSRTVPTSAEMAKGEGLQFVAYLMMILEKRVQSVEVMVISPESINSRKLTNADVDKIEGVMSAIARLQQTLRFGTKGELHDPYTVIHENLPIATLPIDKRVLEQKRKLSGIELEVKK